MSVRKNKLVSNKLNIARYFDSNLLNPRGNTISLEDNTLWQVNNLSGLVTHYDLDGKPLPEIIQIVDNSQLNPIINSKPTGISYNNSRGFVISNNGSTVSSIFLVCTENGKVFAYNPFVNSTSMVEVIDNSSTNASYTGIQIANNRLYLCDFRNGTVDTYDFNYRPLGSLFFSDSNNINLPPNYAPFNIKEIDQQLYVTYAQRNPTTTNIVDGEGFGFVSIFNYDGVFQKRFASGDLLNAPWGMSVIPDSFEKYAGKILIGNYGDGKINIFDNDGDQVGILEYDEDGNPLTITNLWALTAFDNQVYFSAGPKLTNIGPDVNLVGCLKYKKC